MNLKSSKSGDTKPGKVDSMQDMLVKIRQGVSLKPVYESKTSPKSPRSDTKIGGGARLDLEFNAALQARFRKMNIIKEGDDSDKDSNSDGDW